MIVLSKARALPSIPASTACNAIAGLVASGLRVRPLFHLIRSMLASIATRLSTASQKILYEGSHELLFKCQVS